MIFANDSTPSRGKSKFLFALFAVAIANCWSADGAVLRYYEDIQPIVQSKCVGCHRPDGRAEFLPLTSYTEVKDAARLILSAVKSGSMPPWMGESGIQEYINDISLSTDEREKLLLWVGGKQKLKGRESRMRSPPTAATAKFAEISVDHEFESPPFMPRPKTNFTHCYAFDWPYLEGRYVTGSFLKHSSSSQVHHDVVYAIPPKAWEKVVARSPQMAKSSFDCELNMVRDDEKIFLASTPGPLPLDTGVFVPPGSKIISDVHYNTIYMESPVEDVVRLKLTTAETVRHPARFLFLEAERSAFLIRPGEKNVRITRQFQVLRELQKSSSDFAASRGELNLYGMQIHMHNTGYAAELNLLSGDSRIPLVKIRNWLPMANNDFWLRHLLNVNENDRVEFTCAYDNSSDNPRRPMVNGQPIELRWGVDMNAEMCLLVLYLSKGGKG